MLPIGIQNVTHLNHDTESYDWKKRTESLKRAQEISILFDDVVEGSVGISGQHYLA